MGVPKLGVGLVVTLSGWRQKSGAFLCTLVVP